MQPDVIRAKNQRWKCECSRWFAVAVQLHGAGTFLGEERGHFLHLAMLHGGEEALVVFVPLIDLQRTRERERETVRWMR